MPLYNLLIIDDTDDLLGLREELKCHSEYEVIHERSVDTIQQTLAQNKIFGIIAKWELIQDNEIPWMEQLKEETLLPSVPIFIVADSCEQEDRLKIFYKGATELFPSSFLPEELFLRLSFYLVQTFLHEGRLKRFKQIKKISEFYDNLNGLDPILICQKMLDFSNQDLGIQWVSIWWYNKQDETLEIGQHSSPHFPFKSVKREESKMWGVLESSKSLILGSLDLKGENSSHNGRKGLALIVPMIADDVWLGVVNFTNFSSTFFEQYDLDDLDSLCARFSSCLGYALSYQKILEQEQELSKKNHELKEVTEELQHFLDIQESISTNLLQTSQELDQSKSRLEDLHRMKDEFLAIASHDLRSPLSGIYSAVETILECFEVEEDVKDLLTPIMGLCNDHLLQVSELLNVAKLEAGEMGLEYEILSDEAFIKQLHEIRNQLEILSYAKKIDLTLEIKSCPSEVELDLSKIRQLINNLIGNAIKFTDEGGKIKIIILAPEPDWVQITIQDSGIGIKPENIDKIFNKYEQAKNRSVGTKGERGTGLGLAICKGLVELHQGHIWVESEFGRGSAFHSKFPNHPANTIKTIN